MTDQFLVVAMRLNNEQKYREQSGSMAAGISETGAQVVEYWNDIRDFYVIATKLYLLRGQGGFAATRTVAFKLFRCSGSRYS